MFPTVGAIVNEVYLVFVSDFVTEKKEKNKIAKRLERLKNESGALNKDFSEFISYSEIVLNDYFKEEMLSNAVMAVINDTILNYRRIITHEGTYLSKKLSKEWFWAYYYRTFKDIIEDKLSYFKLNGLLVPEDLDIFFIETKTKSTPLSKVLEWVLNISMCTQEGLAEKLKSLNDIDTNRKKVSRWMNEWQNFNADNFFYDVEPFLATLKKERNIYLGFKLSLYFAVALTKLYNNLKMDCLSVKAIDVMANQSHLDPDNYFNCLQDSLVDNSEAIRFSEVYLDLKELNKKIESKSIERSHALSEIQKYETNQILKQFDFSFAHHIASAKVAYYYYENYEKTLSHYLKVFEFGRYKLGPEIKQICIEALKSARNVNDKKSFKKIYYWLTFILKEEFRDPLGNVTSFDELWAYFKKYKYFLKVNSPL